MDEAVLETHGFPGGQIHRRDFGESYGQLAIRLMPDLIIEDDCESIGAATRRLRGSSRASDARHPAALLSRSSGVLLTFRTILTDYSRNSTGAVRRLSPT